MTNTLLPPEAIQEFKELYLKRYKVELSDEEAGFRANNLVRFYELVLSEPDQDDGHEIRTDNLS